ncbi:MAG: acetate/propionate family kinase [Phycisphaeraceae bacterium]|nr:acetate/propionate family kinase [Phycisphaeraceae bacterium]
MILLVANLGSTSFKYKLFDFSDPAAPTVLASGTADRIGQAESAWEVEADGADAQGQEELADHGAAIDLHLQRLTELGVIDSIEAIDAIGFKAVHGGPISEAVRVDDQVIATMEQFADVAPQHNPPYVAAMRAFERRLPNVPQVAAFETGFHQTIPEARQAYGIPYAWMEDLGIRRYGFHGASHRYVATRMAEIDSSAQRVISCHLGGSCSINGTLSEESVFNSFGMTAQSGLFHASRVGDFDVFALQKLTESGLGLDEILDTLGSEAGLKGLSGVSSDIRDVRKAAEDGNERARRALDAFVEHGRRHVGAALTALNGVDALVFTGGIGQHGPDIRAGICREMDFAGITLDDTKNKQAPGSAETQIDAGGTAQVWVLPTNEELIVARQTAEVLGVVTAEN